MKRQASGATDIGNSRQSNEDNFAILDEMGVYMVSDGMGGHAAGEIASEKAVEFVTAHLQEHLEEFTQLSQQPGGYYRLLELAEDAVQAASQRIHHLACTSEGLAGMGTTLTMLLIVDSKGIMSHVGDSRLYLLRDGRVHMLSTDHTLANELFTAGGLSEEEARESHLQHVLTRSLGQQEMVDVESLLFDTQPNDTFLLCSDGLSQYMETAELTNWMSNEDLAAGCDGLIQLAKERGGADNITVVMTRLPKANEADATAETLDVLRQSSLFRGLPLNRLMRLVNIAETCEWSTGEEVVAQGTKLRGLHYVISGELTAGPRTLGPGDAFGESALVRSHASPTTVHATEPTRTLFISGREFDLLTRRVPKLGRRLLRRLATQLSHQVVHVSEELVVSLPDAGPWGESD